MQIWIYYGIEIELSWGEQKTREKYTHSFNFKQTIDWPIARSFDTMKCMNQINIQLNLYSSRFFSRIDRIAWNWKCRKSSNHCRDKVQCWIFAPATAQTKWIYTHIFITHLQVVTVQLLKRIEQTPTDRIVYEKNHNFREWDEARKREGKKIEITMVHISTFIN